MNVQSIPGQDQAKRMLLSGLSSGKVSHAYLFEGPPGTGKAAAAMAFAKAILCEREQPDACGECLSCRKVVSGNHTALHIVSPEGASVKIDQIRELQKHFAYRSSEDTPVQVYIVQEADRMTMQAANSLLKFLEEPEASVTAILITANGQALLPTIRSRVQTVNFVPLAPETMVPVLLKEGLPEELVQPAVRLAAGLDAAKELVQLNWFAEIRNVVIQLAKECSGRGQSALVTAQHKLVKTELSDHLDTLFDLFVLWFKDMIQMQLNRREQLVFIDQTEYIAGEAFQRPASEWMQCMKAAMEARRRLSSHVHAQLAVDRFLLSVERRS